MGARVVRRLLGGVAVAVTVVAAGASSGSAGAAVELAPCDVQGVSARCGTFTVPENYALPSGRTIGLNVVVVPALRRSTLPNAFTYLAGGPGGAATQMTSWVVKTFRSIHAQQDILLVDQRGTGMSNMLVCTTPSHPLNTVAKRQAYARNCFRSLNSDVRQYGTRNAMDDLDALRVALGYDQLDVYGASYGASAAQVFLKEHPSSVRTVVLDGATAIDVPFFGRFAVNAQAALDDVAKRCAAGPACRNAFPGWRAEFSELVRTWDAHPVQSGENVKTTGAGLAGVVQSMLLDATSAAAIPLVVSRAAAGDYEPLNRNIEQGSAALDLMYYSIWCNEPWVGLSVRGPWGTDFDSNTEAALAFHRGICAYIPKRAEPASAWTLPRSKAPLLLLAGGADPQDPIANMPRLKQVFPDSRAIVVAGYGHTVAQYGCMGAIVSRFVIDGGADGLDTSCVAAIKPPPFLLR